jgi:hypothetical protein
VRLLDRSGIKQDQNERLFRTRALFVHFTPERIRRSVVDEQWLRIIRDGEEIGYSYVVEEIGESLDALRAHWHPVAFGRDHRRALGSGLLRRAALGVAGIHDPRGTVYNLARVHVPERPVLIAAIQQGLQGGGRARFAGPAVVEAGVLNADVQQAGNPGRERRGEFLGAYRGGDAAPVHGQAELLEHDGVRPIGLEPPDIGRQRVQTSEVPPEAARGVVIPIDDEDSDPGVAQNRHSFQEGPPGLVVVPLSIDDVSGEHEDVG